jgi:hypothetical protein
MSTGVCHSDQVAVEVKETFQRLYNLWDGYVPAGMHYNGVISPMGDVPGCKGNLIDLIIQDVKKVRCLIDLNG